MFQRLDPIMDGCSFVAAMCQDIYQRFRRIDIIIYDEDTVRNTRTVALRP